MHAGFGGRPLPPNSTSVGLAAHAFGWPADARGSGDF